MAVGFKIDNETLALSVIIGAGLLYYFTHDQLTAAEVKHKRDDDRKDCREEPRRPGASL